MCNYKGLRLKGFAEQKSATHLTLQYIIINSVKNFLYVCTEYVSIMKCYINWCNSPMMGDKNTKNMKYILNCQLLSMSCQLFISIIHDPYICPIRPSCNTCHNECNGTCNTMVMVFINLLWMVVLWFRSTLFKS